MKTSLLFAPLVLAALSFPASSAADTITTTYGWNMNLPIPDNNANGLVDVRTVPADITSIQLLTVALETVGGWNGDLYAYLHHSSGFSVLLNRPGRTVSLPAGSPTSGMNVIIADAAAQELHAMPLSGPVTGIWKPDARSTDPGGVLDTDSRTSLLSNFTGVNPAGAWALYIADVAAGDEATLKSWSITVTGTAIPEPSALLLLSLCGGTAALRRRRQS